MPATNRNIEAVLSGSGGRWRPGLLLVILVLAILGAGALWYWWAASRPAAGMRYTTEAADRGDIIVTVTATGTVEPTNKVEISSEMSGTVRSVDIDFNDTVKVGQVLARLDTDSLEAGLERARANLAAAEAHVAEVKVTLAETKATFDRAAILEEKGFSSTQAFLASKAAYDRASASLQSAEANVAVARADLNVNETSLNKACICSPIDGVVLDRNVEVGQIVAASFSAPVLFTLAEDLTKMQLQVDIDEADIGRVNDGDQAMFTVEAYQDKSFPAAISELRFAPFTVNGVVTYKAILAIDNADLLLRPGMTATAEIAISEAHDVLRLPNATLRYSPPAITSESSGGLFAIFSQPTPASPLALPANGNGQRTVWVLRDGSAQPVLVTTGDTDGTHTEILSGDIVPGDRIIVDASAG